MRKSLLALLASLAVAGSIHVIVTAQVSVGQNMNIVTGSADQITGDLFRQRQTEPVLGISSINPSHMMAAYVDYRTVDFAHDPGSVVPPSPLGFTAKLMDFLRAPWQRDRKGQSKPVLAAAQAWIGLSFTDNGTDWYTGLLPGHPFGQSAEDYASPLRMAAYEAASDPVMAALPDKFLLGGIAFTPNGGSAGFVARFVDRNDTETGQNIQYEWTKVLVAQPTRYFVDKPAIAAGPNGRVYAAFVVFDQADPQKLSSKIQVYRSANYGETWSGPVTVSDPLTRNQSPWMVVDPNNENTVYIGWRVFSARSGGIANAIVGKKSTNGGQSFAPVIPYPVALLLKAFDQPQGLLPASLPIPRSNAYPTAAIDGDGGIHVALQEYVYPANYPTASLRGTPLAPNASPTIGVPRITVTSSYTGGLLWTPRKAIDFGAGTGTQFVPVLTAVGEPGPSCSGSSGPRSRIILMYYDARAGGAGVTPGSTGYVAGASTQFDVRIAQASACNRDNLGRPIFSASEPVSQYERSAQPPHNVVTRPPYGVSAVNRPYPMSCGGNCAFTGDYIHLSPRVTYVQAASGWKLTTANGVDKNKLPAPVVQGVWSDNRDVLLPTSGSLRTGLPANASAIDVLPWQNYQEPGTGLASCINPGSRDQNIFMAQYAPGLLFATAPETFRVSDIPRAYPVYVENRAGQQRFFRLTIDTASNASFDFGSFDPTSPSFNVLDKEADVAIGPYSSVTGSVVLAPQVAQPVLITVEQIGVSAGGLPVPMPNGVRTTVTLYTSGLSAASPTETRTPVVSPTAEITYPFAGRLPITVNAGSPFTQNPFVQNPFSQNPFSQNPFSQNPFSQNPFTQNPFTQNPFTQNPFAQNTTIYEVTDISFRVTNAGSHDAAYTALLNVQNALQLTGSYFFQVLINRASPAPVMYFDQSGQCQAFDGARPIQVSSIVTPFSQNPFTQNPFSQNPFSQNPFTQNPFSQNPFSQNPFTQNPFSQNPFSQNTDPRDPAVSNSSFYIAPQQAPPPPQGPEFRAQRPPDEVIYTLRAYQIKAPNDPTLVPLIPPGSTQPPVGIVVVADTPDVIPLAGGGVGFDPAGPPAASGGSSLPVHLQFVQQPTPAAPGAAITPAVRVAIMDGQGAVLPGTSIVVTLAIGTNPGAGVLAGTLTHDDDDDGTGDGIATFPGLSINNAGTGYTLAASSSGLTLATSNAFDITAGSGGFGGAIHSDVQNTAVISHPITMRAAQGLGGDANRDLVVLHETGLVTTMSGDGAGHFDIQFQALVPGTNGVPRDLRTADINQDGIPDVIVIYDGIDTNNLAILRSDGNFAWASNVVHSVQGIPRGVVVGQFNATVDAYLDIAVASAGPSGLTLLLGDGSGGFTALPTLNIGAGGVSAIAAGRLNSGDAFDDVLIVKRGSQSVHEFLGDGAGGFTDHGSFGLEGNIDTRTPSDSAEAIALADFNEDGYIDVAIATDAPAVADGQAVITMLNDADGHLGTVVRHPLSLAPLGLTTGDFNNDGHEDIATVNPTNNNVAVVFGDGDNAFGTPVTMTAGNTPQGITSADFTSDGKPELVVANRLHRLGDASNDEVSTFINASAGAAPFAVINTNDGGPGSLRAALTNANARAGLDEIVFNIPGAGPHTIMPATPLPAIDSPAIVDATTQPGYSGTPVVALNGAGAGPGADGLAISAGSSLVRGLAIGGFGGFGILLTSGGNHIAGNYIGTNTAGTAALPNGSDGIRIEGAPGNLIGGVLGTGNLISGNLGKGVYVRLPGSTGTVIQGNIIGLDASGTTALGNADSGIQTFNAGIHVGGTAPGARNIISANNNGIALSNSGSTFTTIIKGNYIGTDITGNADRGNGVGVNVGSAPGTRIGGPEAGARNVISGNQTGVAIFNTTNTEVQGNFIGTNAAGTTPLGGTFGVHITTNASNNLIGGTAPGAGNIISGNVTGMEITGGSSGNVVQGNTIGLNAVGAALGNSNGIVIYNTGGGATNNTIGGPVAGARNIISGNVLGVSIGGANTTGNVVQGNYIGTDPTGTVALGNAAQGVLIQENAASNTVGGVVSGAGNVISGNGVGVQLANGATGNFVRGNLIGLNANGTAALGNTSQGVSIGQGATITTVGGASPAARNIISGNAHGVTIADAGTSISIVQGNYIGTDITGALAIGNADRGVWILNDASNTNIGGAGPGEGNVIAANPGGNIWLDGAGVSNTVIQGNLIGVNAAGTAGFGAAQQFGINVPGATNTIIGGTTPAARNVISGTQKGIQLLGTSNTIIQGNFLGTTASGFGAIANSGYGVFIAGSAATTIGGPTLAEGNVISGNGTAVYILAATGETSINNLLQRNYIGTAFDGVTALANGNGVVLQANPGGTLTGSTMNLNTVAFNTSAGIVITGAGATNNQILTNSIFGNTGIGIDLGADGITANDGFDADGGPNLLQNFPVVLGPTTTSVTGELFSAPNLDYTVQFFSSGTSNREGKTLIATSIVHTDSAGHVVIGPLPATIASGQWVTATAADFNGNTSEFSAAVQVP